MKKNKKALERSRRRGGTITSERVGKYKIVPRVNFNVPDDVWQDEVLRKIPTWAKRRALYEHLKAEDHHKARAYWLAFIASLDQREKACKKKKKITGLLTVYLRGEGDCIAALNGDGRYMSGEPGTEVLINQINRGIASDEGLVFVKSRKLIARHELFPSRYRKSRRRQLSVGGKRNILEMYRRGFTIREIAEKLAVSRSSVSRSIKGGLA